MTRKLHWTILQAADEVKVARKTVYDWLDTGRVRASSEDAAGRPLFTEKDMERLREEAGRARRRS